MTLTNSPVSENTATGATSLGGGIVGHAVTLTDSSVSENTATDSGGGLDAQGTVSL